MTTVAALSAKFARDIEKAMAERNISRSELAILLRVSRPYITQVLSGKANLTFKTASLMAEAVGLKSWVVYEVEEPEKPAEKPAGRSTEQERLFEVSGSVVLTGKLEALLYLLMRDHVPPGVIGGLMQDLKAAGENSFTNGWLARYAEHLAGELRSGEELTSEGAKQLADIVSRPGKRIPKLAAILKRRA